MNKFYLTAFPPLTLCLLMIGCSEYGDGIYEKDPEEGMKREANCVAASERFLLYEEAKRHLEHGNTIARIRYRETGTLNDFPERVTKARLVMNELPKDFNAVHLEAFCDRKLTVREFSQSLER